MKTSVQMVYLLASVLAAAWCTEGNGKRNLELLASSTSSSSSSPGSLGEEETALTSSLLSHFLLQHTQRRDFLILHDSISSSSAAGLAGVVEMCFRSLVDTTLLSYDSLLDLEGVVGPQKVVTRAHVRVVVVLCSPNNTRRIFEEVRERSLESRRVRWVVVAEEEDLIHSLTEVVREGTHVGVVLRSSLNLYHVFISHVQPNDKIIFKEVGTWRRNGGGGRTKGGTERRKQTETEKGRTENVTTTRTAEGGTAAVAADEYHFTPKTKRNREKKKGIGTTALAALFPDPSRTYRDFEGRELTVSVVSNFPFFLLLQRPHPLPPLPDRGIDYSIILSLAQYLNFTFKVTVPTDGKWGGPRADGTVTGMIGDVAGHRAHLAIDEITISAARETVVDFTQAYFVESTTLVSRAPAERPRSLAVFYPFSLGLWALLVVVTLVMGPLVYLVRQGHHHALVAALPRLVPPSELTPWYHNVYRRSGHGEEDWNAPRPTEQSAYRPHKQDKEDSNTLTAIEGTDYRRNNPEKEDSNTPRPTDVGVYRRFNQSARLSSSPSVSLVTKAVQEVGVVCFNVFRTLVIQGNLLPAHSWPLRITFFSWYTFCLILYALYAGTLTAYMTKPSYERPIDSLEHLLEAHKDGFVPAVQSGTSNMRLLKDAKQGIFKALWDLTDPTRSFPSGGHVAMDMVLSRDIVYMSSALNSEARATQRGRHRFHLARDTFLPQGYGVACRNGAPFLPVFDTMLGRLVQGGMINKWVVEMVEELRWSEKGETNGRKVEGGGGGGGGEVESKRVKSTALSLDHVQGAFYILSGGSFLAGLVFLLENLSARSYIR